MTSPGRRDRRAVHTSVAAPTCAPRAAAGIAIAGWYGKTTARDRWVQFPPLRGTHNAGQAVQAAVAASKRSLWGERSRLAGTFLMRTEAMSDDRSVGSGVGGVGWDEDDYERDEEYGGDCYWCCGDGWVECDDPIQCTSQHSADGYCRCSSCGGSGLAKDMTIW